jgi:dTDP-4-amino-4,6-dideoxygalactose transaminase
MMRVPFVDLGAQYAAVEQEVEEAVRAVHRRGDYILGEDVRLFEEEFAAYCEVDHAIGVDSGISALELALRALDIGPGDEVITAANTFAASALSISAVGASPVLVDIDPTTHNLDPALLAEAVTPRTRAIMPVHLHGRPAAMDEIMAVAEDHGLKVVEDAAQAHGARYRGRRAGSIGHVAAFSFYPAKNLGAYGDGGAVVTSDPDVADRVRMLRNYGSRQKYHHDLKGYNRRLDTVHAAALRVKLRRLDGWNDLRREHAARYRTLLVDSRLVLPRVVEDCEEVWHLFVVRAGDRDALAEHLTANGISTGIHYPIPIHRLGAYADLGRPEGSYPLTEAAATEILSLPMYPELDQAHIEHVASAIAAYEEVDVSGASPSLVGSERR